MVAAGFGLVALALTARALGPELLGVLALIEAYAALVDRLVRLEPWQALIKYGADALERNERDAFRSLLKLGALLDVGGAAASAGVAAAVVLIAGPWLGWSLGAFAVGWAIQFLGHYYEGRKPAFVDDIRGLLVGPMFVVAEALFGLGWGKSLAAEIEARVGPTRLRDLHAPAAR